MADRRQLGYVSAYTTTSVYAEVYGVATGGTAFPTPPTGYSGLSFTADGTLTVTTAGLFEYLIIGSGGGSDNTAFSNGAGGGGAGQLIEGTAYFAAGTYAVKVGAGGAHNAINIGASGIGTRIFALQGSGGGGGPGASGTGGKGAGSVQAGMVASINTITGYAGGSGSNSPTNGYPGGGGGGMAAAGTNASGGTAGSGGTGVSNSFNGVATTYCRGGFGGSYNGIVNASANTGNGGGDSVGAYGSGGSGLVMVRFKV